MPQVMHHIEFLMAKRHLIGELSRIARLTSSGDDRVLALMHRDSVEEELFSQKDVIEFMNKAQVLILSSN